MIFVDQTGHMVSDNGDDGLHAFAKRLGLKREWYQDGRHPHYDLTTARMRQKALRNGAVYVKPREIISILREG